jgi:TRAP-type C4-dicarboxylate transport system permease small subunit
MLETIVRRFAYALGIIAGISLILMMIQTSLDVVLNNVIHRPIEGNLEVISVYHMVIIVFLPLALVELRHEHICSDLLIQTFSKKWQRISYVLSALITLTFISILFWQTLLDALQSFAIKEVIMGSIYIPVWPAKFALPLGFLCFLCVVLLNMIKAITRPDFDPTPPSIEESDGSAVRL